VSFQLCAFKASKRIDVISIVVKGSLIVYGSYAPVPVHGGIVHDRDELRGRVETSGTGTPRLHGGVAAGLSST